MTRVWPKSLYGQILLVAASALLVAQAINTVLLLAGARNRAVTETSAVLVSRIANQIERSEAVGIDIGQIANDGGTRRERRQRRAPLVSMTIGAQPVTIERADFRDEISERARDLLRQGEIGLTDVRISTVSVNLLPARLRDPQLVRWQKFQLRRPDRRLPKTAILFTARLPDGRWVSAAGLVRPTETASILALLLQTLLLFFAVMVPLALVARRIAKPLQTLTSRVRDVGVTDAPEPMPSEGPDDVKQLIDAFNVMHARVSALLSEKDVMLGAIGHDLKTPLAALRVRIESVDDDAEREKMAATIDEMVTILDDILTLARLGRSGEALQSVDIGALAESVASEFDGTTYCAPDARIVADVRPVLVRRALRNLIGNAITYGKTAEIGIVDTLNVVIIEIGDNGPGIDPASVESMFEPFTRAEKSRSRATGGSGLGLTISRAIARSHGGDVILQNRKKGGLKAAISFKK